MAGVPFRGNTGDLTVTGAGGAKTVAQVVAAANHRIKNLYFDIAPKGVSPTDSHILVEFVKQTTAGTMSPLALVKDDDTQPETLQTTAQYNATVEPTTTDVKKSVRQHPQQLQRRFGPFTVPGGQRLAVRVTVPADVGVSVSFDGEE